MKQVKKVLIIGGGFSGMSAAIELRKQHIAVDMVEVKQQWGSYGAGISLSGATFRALETLGVLDEFLTRGAATDGGRVFLSNGHLLAEFDTPRVAGPDVPGSGAILRPVLADILAEQTRRRGVGISLGVTFQTITEQDDAVSVTFTDGTHGTYDLVIGADGLYSKVREHLFANASKPKYSGQAVWRALVPRQPSVQTLSMWLGEQLKLGLNPVSATEMYLFLTEPAPTRIHVDPQQAVARLKELLSEFTAPEIVRVKEDLSEKSQVIYRPLDGLLMPRPWYRGRVVLIGDTVHATTPHLASGACIGIEDAIVLAEELAVDRSVDASLKSFEERRWQRCRMVVESSARLGQIEIEGGDKQEHANIMRNAQIELAKPI